MNILLTGVCGFILSNFIRRVVVQYPNIKWIGVDKLVKDENINNMFQHPNYQFYLADIADQHTMHKIFQLHKPNIVINGAAESFVDASITDIFPFLHTNIIGTQVMINCCLQFGSQLLHLSTDEIYGQKLSLDDAGWTEEEPLLARNPYACSKASSELIIRAAHETHGLQYKMTRSCNVFGPRQKKLNLIPHIIHSIKTHQPINIHGNGENFRQYIYVEDEIDAILTILFKGKINNIYNIGDHTRLSNIAMAQCIANMMGAQANIRFVNDRKAHDYGYTVNTNKLSQLGCVANTPFLQAMQTTIESYQ